MAKKLLLIHPVDDTFRELNQELSVRLPPLALGILASLTPSDWEIEILDENFDPFTFKPADIVGITAYSVTAPRAYEIASVYKKEGITTIMGGIHASMMTDEALQFVDCVVKGEAESVWPTVIKDFEKGELKKVYSGELLEFKNWPVPRHDLYHKNYKMAIIQTTRGCPMKCNYCSVSLFNGFKYRMRPVDEVISEIKQVGKKYINFLDDNIIGHGKENIARAKELFRRIIDEKLDIHWISHASINMGEDEELLELARKSGCKLVFIGFEVEREEFLKDMNKRFNVQTQLSSYKSVIKKINKFKIGVTGGFMFGMDFDTAETIEKRRKFILRCGVNIIGASIITPFPGTLMYDSFKNDNRILKNNYPHDWQYYNYREVVIQPKGMTVEDLEKGILNVWSSFYSPFQILKTFITAVWRMRSLDTPLWILNSCRNRRRAIKYFNFVAHKKSE